MKHPITVYMAFASLLAGVSICVAGSQAQAQKPQEKTQAEAGSTETEAQAYHELSKAEQDCIVRMLSASTLAQAKARKATCKDSFPLRAYYASLLEHLHAPGADEEIVRNMPQNLVDLHTFYMNTFDKVSESDFKLVGYAYERYYKSLFRIVTERPSLLPRFFPIAARFGADSGDNLDESGWFCGALNNIYKKIPADYMQAVRQTKNKEYRENARGYALHPIP